MDEARGSGVGRTGSPDGQPGLTRARRRTIGIARAIGISRARVLARHVAAIASEQPARLPARSSGRARGADAVRPRAARFARGVASPTATHAVGAVSTRARFGRTTRASKRCATTATGTTDVGRHTRVGIVSRLDGRACAFEPGCVAPHAFRTKRGATETVDAVAGITLRS